MISLEVYEQVREINPDDIKPYLFQSEPWLSGSDIDFYDYSCHMIYLKEPLSITGGDQEEEYMFAGRPFVVVVDNVSCWLI